tara:strand:- start:12652 stop:12810 length:159 start_codon:yes stop_codon:yes gene_type:complete
VSNKVINESIAKSLLSQAGELLGGEIKYMVCTDRTTEHRKVVIEWDHQEKGD